LNLQVRSYFLWGLPIEPFDEYGQRS
jgi:hypothetical protein